MQIGMIGLGRMGANMARRLIQGGHEAVVYDRNPESVALLVREGARGARDLAELVTRLVQPRATWLMLPAGQPTEDMLAQLARKMDTGDVLIDGGNSFYKDDVRRAEQLRARGLHYVDVGTSGGVWGVERGYCLMIGGEGDVVQRLDPILKTLAPGRAAVPRTPGRERAPAEAFHGSAEEGYLHCGPAGAGHFVKMIHNGIEYGLMQAYAEGFDIFHSARASELPEPYRYDLNLADIAEVWRRGSVIGSWLLDLTAMALLEQPRLERYSGQVADSGEGRWSVLAAVEEAVPATVMTAALYARFRSRQAPSFADRVLSAMREKFGGHVERPAGG